MLKILCDRPKIVLTALSCTLLVLTVFVNIAFTDDLTGSQIIENVCNRDKGNDLSSEMTFIIESANRKNKIRKIKQVWLDLNGKNGFSEKSMFFFLAPPDIKDTAFLSWNYKEYNNDDEQWVYLPALRKVRRIASSSKNDSFFGTEFSYADLNTREFNEDEHKLLKKESFQGFECYVVESIPKNSKDAYSKIVSWINSTNWIILKSEFYDKKGNHLKTLVLDWALLQNILTRVNLVMTNHINGNTTLVKIDNTVYNKELKEDLFNERTLKRGIND